MASISTDTNGNHKVQFTNCDGKRKTVYLGDMPMKDVKEVRTKIKALNAATLSKSEPDREVSRWVGEIPDWLAKKLGGVGLIAPREKQIADATSIDAFINAYLAERVDLKPSTVVQLHQVRKNLRNFIGDKRTLREFTPGDADAFKASLVSKPICWLSMAAAPSRPGAIAKTRRLPVRTWSIAVRNATSF